jgi:cytochrome d ubiquinol oxidase subunit I
VTTEGNVWLLFAGTLVLYLLVGAGTVYVLRLVRRHWHETTEDGGQSVRYAPAPAGEKAAISTSAG